MPKMHQNMRSPRLPSRNRENPTSKRKEERKGRGEEGKKGKVG